jgi:hypothetical protein
VNGLGNSQIKRRDLCFAINLRKKTRLWEEKLSTENNEAKNYNRQIWGWIMAILGGVFSVVSKFFSLQPYYEVFELGHDM